jgi:NAD(P)-dependent dehydrogenase (short-subunit alcohol dehydrogenase family)
MSGNALAQRRGRPHGSRRHGRGCRRADALRGHDPVHNAGVIRPALVADVKLDDLDALDDARAVSFFASRDAGFVTGQVLYVCGGTSVGSLTL